MNDWEFLNLSATNWVALVWNILILLECDAGRWVKCFLGANKWKFFKEIKVAIWNEGWKQTMRMWHHWIIIDRLGRKVSCEPSFFFSLCVCSCFLFLFPFPSKLNCVPPPGAKSSLCQSWQFEHTFQSGSEAAVVRVSPTPPRPHRLKDSAAGLTMLPNNVESCFKVSLHSRATKAEKTSVLLYHVQVFILFSGGPANFRCLLH